MGSHDLWSYWGFRVPDLGVQGFRGLGFRGLGVWDFWGLEVWCHILRPVRAQTSRHGRSGERGGCTFELLVSPDAAADDDDDDNDDLLDKTVHDHDANAVLLLVLLLPFPMVDDDCAGDGDGDDDGADDDYGGGSGGCVAMVIMMVTLMNTAIVTFAVMAMCHFGVFVGSSSIRMGLGDVIMQHRTP